MLKVDVDDNLLTEVKKRLAGRKGATVGSLVRDALCKFVGRNLKTRYDYVHAFADGALSRQQVQEALGLTYGEVLMWLSRYELELPRVSPERAERDASKLAALI